MVKVDILLNGKPVDALSQLAYKPEAAVRAKKVCERLKGEISRQQFKIAIQGAIGSQIIARETVNPVRKDVLAKCYGENINENLTKIHSNLFKIDQKIMNIWYRKTVVNQFQMNNKILKKLELRRNSESVWLIFNSHFYVFQKEVDLTSDPL